MFRLRKGGRFHAKGQSSWSVARRVRYLPRTESVYQSVARLETDKEKRGEVMNVEIDYLIEATENLLKRFQGSKEVALSIVLLCALELFKKEKESEVNSVRSN